MRPDAGLSPVRVPTVTPALHNVAVVGIDFDPPLELVTGLDSGVTLLVAVENQGLSTEPAVNMTARLVDPTAAGEQRNDLVHESVILRALEPGEVRVVRFTEVSDLPVREHYQLVVELTAVEGERDLGDNMRAYDVLIGRED